MPTALQASATIMAISASSSTTKMRIDIAPAL
jgi:hypothetical protein